MTKPAAKPRRKILAETPPPPSGLSAAEFVRDGEVFIVLSYPVSSRPPIPESLTPAEREVATLLVAGQRSADIARSRGTSLRTVANQIQSIYKKLDVNSRTELARRLGSSPRSVKREP